MKQFLTIVICLASLYYFYPSHASTRVQKKAFESYVTKIRQRAKAAHVSEQTLNKYLSNLKAPTVKKQKHLLHIQKNTAVRSLPFSAFMQRFISNSTVHKSRERYHQYRHVLLQIQKRFHVQPQYPVAIWAIESDFGRDVGTENLIHALINLGFTHQSSDFYQAQVIDGLVMLDKHYQIPQQLKSTFDAGMGQPQFEPSTYLMFAVDFDGDGFKNIWTNIPDALASIANFLHKNHWDGNKTWGLALEKPSKAASALASIHHFYPMQRWITLGVKTKSGKALENSAGKAALLLPIPNNPNTAFLILHNYKVLMRWNNSIMESLAIGKLANLIQK